MKYFKIDADTFLGYDETTGDVSTIKKSDTQNELADKQGKLDHASSISDADLLAWAKEHNGDYLHKATLEQEVSDLNKLLTELNNVK